MKTGDPGVKGPDPGVKTGDPGVKGPDPSVKTGDPSVKGPDPGVKTGDPSVKGPDPGVKTGDPSVKGPDPGVKTGDPGVKEPDPGVKTGDPSVKRHHPAVKMSHPTLKRIRWDAEVEQSSFQGHLRVNRHGALKVKAALGMIAATKLDACIRNYYRTNPEVLAAWTHARHIERAPRRTPPETARAASINPASNPPQSSEVQISSQTSPSTTSESLSLPDDQLLSPFRRSFDHGLEARATWHGLPAHEEAHKESTAILSTELVPARLNSIESNGDGGGIQALHEANGQTSSRPLPSQ